LKGESTPEVVLKCSAEFSRATAEVRQSQVDSIHLPDSQGFRFQAQRQYSNLCEQIIYDRCSFLGEIHIYSKYFTGSLVVTESVLFQEKNVLECRESVHGPFHASFQLTSSNANFHDFTARRALYNVSLRDAAHHL